MTYFTYFSPEAVGDKDHPALQKERGADPDEVAHTQALEQTLEVHVFQSGVQRSAEFDGLESEKVGGGLLQPQRQR